jgi:hypothetical protein
MTARRTSTDVEYVIYCHRHVATGRAYVGQTCRGMMCRWTRHVYDARSSSLPFHRAIIKYGPGAFSHEILERLTSVEASNLAEAAWIKRLNCIVPNGFNLDAGGGVGRVHQSTKQKMSALMRKRAAAMTSEERRAQGRKAFASLSPEKRREVALARAGKFSPEERRARGLKARATAVANGNGDAVRLGSVSMSPEARSERSRRSNAVQTPEERSDRIRKAWERRSAERRAEIGRRISEVKRSIPAAIRADAHRRAAETKRERYGPPKPRAAYVPRTPVHTAAQRSQMAATRQHSSKYKGVCWHSEANKWRATIVVDGRQRHLGLFSNEESAAMVYDCAARENFGEFARCNLAAPVGNQLSLNFKTAGTMARACLVVVPRRKE